MHWETLRFSIVNNGIALLKKLRYSTPMKHLLSFYRIFLRFHLNYCDLFNEQPCSVKFPDTVESIQYNTAAKHLLSFYKIFLRFHLNYCDLFNEQPCSVKFPDTVESIQYNTAAKHLLSFYSETSLQRTPTGSQNSVRYRQVSATKRLFLNWLILLQKLTLGC